MTPFRSFIRRASFAGFSAGLAVLASCANNTNPNGGRGAFMQKTWATKEFQQTDVQKKYSSVYIAPVNTSKLSKQDWWSSQNARTQSEVLAKDAQKLGRQLRTSLEREIRAYPGNRLSIASSPGPNTLTIETAITELVPSKAYWNAGATAAGFVVPGAGLLSAAGAGKISIGGRLSDSSGTQATFSDTRTDDMSPINMRGYSWYGGSERNIETWAKQGAAFLHAPPGSEIKRASSITLNPF